jgi:hypothetical protein
MLFGLVFIGCPDGNDLNKKVEVVNGVWGKKTSFNEVAENPWTNKL